MEEKKIWLIKYNYNDLYTSFEIPNYLVEKNNESNFNDVEAWAGAEWDSKMLNDIISNNKHFSFFTSTIILRKIKKIISKKKKEKKSHFLNIKNYITYFTFRKIKNILPTIFFSFFLFSFLLLFLFPNILKVFPFLLILSASSFLFSAYFISSFLYSFISDDFYNPNLMADTSKSYLIIKITSILIIFAACFVFFFFYTYIFIFLLFFCALILFINSLLPSDIFVSIPSNIHTEDKINLFNYLLWDTEFNHSLIFISDDKIKKWNTSYIVKNCYKINRNANYTVEWQSKEIKNFISKIVPNYADILIMPFYCSIYIISKNSFTKEIINVLENFSIKNKIKIEIQKSPNVL